MTLPEAQISIKSIRTREVLVPFRRPLATRAGLFAAAPLLLVDLHCGNGIVGRIPVFGFLPSGPSLISAAIRTMAASLLGQRLEAGDLTATSGKLEQQFQLLGRQGLVRFAQSVLDMALYDAMARSVGMPLYAFLGAEKSSVSAYNSNGLGLISAAEASVEALRLLEERGFTHIKCRGGRARPEEDIEVVDAILGALPSSAKLSIDFNQCLTAAEAHDRLRGIDDFGLAWIEEPVQSDDLALSASLSNSLSTPVMMGENYYGPDSVERAIEAKAFDLLMPDVLRIGGVSGWLQAANFAAHHDVEMSSHLSPEFSIHLLSATKTAGWLEYVDWGSELIKEPLIIASGKASPPDRPGAGIEWNEDLVAKHLKSDTSVE